MKIRTMTRVALFAALTAVGAFIRIPLGYSSITLQTFFTAMAGCVLGPWYGALSQLVYVALGLVGLPIFTQGGGIGYLMQPTCGFLIGLIPMAFTSVPYARWAQAAGRDVRLWQVAHAQHFDGFLALPDYAARYVPLLPYVYAALDRVDAHLAGAGPLPADAAIATTPRGPGKALEPAHLAIPR